MKKLILLMLLAGTFASARAQFQVNPQFGLNMQRMTDPGIPGLEYRAAIGWQFGVDMRFGERLYFQPGAFYGRSATVIKQNWNDTLAFEDDLVRTTLKLRPMVGYRLLDTYQVNVRFAMGPSYDVLLSVDNRHDRAAYGMADMRNGSLNWDAALGFDLGHFTIEPSASFGLSRVFTDRPVIRDIHTKYMTYALTIGINLGDDDR